MILPNSKLYHCVYCIYGGSIVSWVIVRGASIVFWVFDGVCWGLLLYFGSLVGFGSCGFVVTCGFSWVFFVGYLSCLCVYFMCT